MAIKINGGSYPTLTKALGIQGTTQVVLRPMAGNMRYSPANAGQLAFANTPFTSWEGSTLSFSVSRNLGASGTVAVDWSMTVSEGAPTPSNGTISWNNGEAGIKTVQVQAGLVTADRTGTITLSNPRSLSSGAAPTISGATQSFTIQNDTTGPSQPTLGALSVVSSSELTVPLAFGSTDAQSGIQDHALEQAQGDGSTAFTQIAQGASIFPRSVTSLAPATMYRYRARGRNRAGIYSIYSPIVEAITQSNSSGEWADTYGDHSGIELGISVDRRRYGIRPSTLAGWHPQYLVGTSVIDYVSGGATGNGAQFTVIPNGSFNGLEPALEMRPPTIFQGQNPGDAKILSTHLYRGGLNSNAQINIRFLMFIGPRYFDLGAETKLDGLMCAPNNTTPGSSSTGRVNVYTQRISGIQYPGVTIGTTQTYNYPPEGYSADVGAASTKLCRIAGSPNHALNAPQIGNEWVCFEHVFDCRQDRGNPFGMNKFYMWTRDRAADGRFLRIDLTWAAWDFANRYIQTYEGLGFYFNNISTAHADNYVRFSHWTIAANMGINEVMGPPADF